MDRVKSKEEYSHESGNTALRMMGFYKRVSKNWNTRTVYTSYNSENKEKQRESRRLHDTRVGGGQQGQLGELNSSTYRKRQNRARGGRDTTRSTEYHQRTIYM